MKKHYTRAVRARATKIALGLWLVAVASHGAETPKPPPRVAFVRPPAVLRARDEAWFTVHVPRHQDNRRLRVELQRLQPVAWTPTFPFEGSAETAPSDDLVRYEPDGEAIRASEEPLEGDDARAVVPIQWKPLPDGRYELIAKVSTSKGITYTARHRLTVGVPDATR